MSTSKATASWTGGLKDGHGMMKPAHGAELPFSASSRFEGAPATNPEELVGAALAGCFSMALTVALERAGFPPQSVATSADVELERGTAGFAITTITLRTVAHAPGLDEGRFQSIALETKKGCPVSKALAGTRIELEATLKA